MFARSFALVLVVAFSFVLASGQSSAAHDAGVDKPPKTSTARSGEKLRDLPFPGGVDLQFIIKELARDLDLNVLFDADSFRGPRKTNIDLKNVTAAAALDHILLQERLFAEAAGPKTIIVAVRAKQLKSIPQIGVDVMTMLTEQLAHYFGVTSGILITNVRPDSPGFRAGLKAGDVIVEMDGMAMRYPYALFEAINKKKEGDIALTIVRDRDRQTIRVTPEREAGAGYVLRGPDDTGSVKKSE